MQYGLDSAVIGSLQAMPGFLVVFGYPDPEAPGGYAIDVSFLYPADSTNMTCRNSPEQRLTHESIREPSNN